jgi:hypothetical protein
MTPEKLLRSTYGDLRPIRVTVNGEKNRTLIYPRGAGDPDAEAVRKSFAISNDGFRSLAGRVSGDTYVGRNSAGGFSRQIRSPDVRFSEPCGFMMQLRGGKVVAIETDRAVQADVQGRKVTLAKHVAMDL